MVRRDSDSVEFIYCACNCQKTLAKYKYHHGQYRERKYISGHQWRGKKRNTVTKGEKHHNWKGDDVGIVGLHLWIRRNFPKPEKCHLCRNVEPQELACITSIYNRELKNWAWFCIRCHRKWDNLIERNLKPFAKHIN